MGMTYEQYWEEPPYLAAMYRKAFKIRRELENEMAWLNGLYTYDALAVCMANVFSKRGAKKQTYLEKPIDIFPLTDAEKEKREQAEYAKMQSAMEEMVKAQRRKKKLKGD